jgi:hypothetical protein
MPSPTHRSSRRRRGPESVADFDQAHCPGPRSHTESDKVVLSGSLSLRDRESSTSVNATDRSVRGPCRPCDEWFPVYDEVVRQRQIRIGYDTKRLSRVGKRERLGGRTGDPTLRRWFGRRHSGGPPVLVFSLFVCTEGPEGISGNMATHARTRRPSDKRRKNDRKVSLPPAPSARRFITMNDVLQIFPYSRQHIYTLIGNGAVFRHPFRLARIG